jgi:phosphoribosylamine--glycine ligase
MKILFMSKSGDGLGIAYQIKKEGHDVRFYIKESGYQFAGLGLVERVPSWRPSAGDWADFIIADMVGFGRNAVTLDNFNVPHLGFNPIADMFELDRQKQMQVFNKLGVRTPDTFSFSSPSHAEEIADSWEDPGFVIKPSGNIETAKTYMCEDEQTYRWALEQYKGSQPLIVQRIVHGVEVSTEGWFNGVDWVKPFNHTFEEKRFLEGNIGPNTGCMGNVVMAAPGKNNQLVENLKRLSPFLRAAKYKGPVDLNTIVNQDGIFALEVTARIGYDAIEALDTLMTDPLSEFLMGIATSAKSVMHIRDEFGIAVRVSVPPYPHSNADVRDRDLPVTGVDLKTRNVYFTDTYWDKKNKIMRWAAADGVVLKVTGKGKTLNKAQEDVYKTINGIKILGMQYRRDIGSRVAGDIQALKKMRIFHA